jgi:hypothetical protein
MDKEKHMETIKSFAEIYRVRVKQDDCGELIIPGSLRGTSGRLDSSSHIYDHGDSRRFGVLLTFGTKRGWHFAKRRLLAAGFTLGQDCDTEGTALFDPQNHLQARLALRLARIRAIRTLSPEQRQKMADRMRNARRFKAANVGRALEAIFFGRSGGTDHFPPEMKVV